MNRAVRTPLPRIKCTRCGRSVSAKRGPRSPRREVNRGTPAIHLCPHGRPCLVLEGLPELACVECEALNVGPAENPRPVSSVQEGTLGLASCSADALHELSDSERAAVKRRSS